MIKLKDLINEEFIGELDGIEVFKNPKSIKRMKGDLRGKSFPNGDLFVVDDAWDILHWKLSQWLNRNGYKNLTGGTKDSLVKGIKQGFIEWQRKGKTNDFYLSESTDFDDVEWFNKNELMPYLKKYSKKVKQKNSQYNFKLKSIYE